MANMSKMDRLEVGGNIFELIEFSLDRTLLDGSIKTGRYGVNVAKVREVVRMPVINPLASSIEGVAGVFELRGIPIPAIHLAVALGDRHAVINPANQIIVTEFSMKRAGFIVKSTERIRRIAWEKVLPPASDRKTCISGMTLVEDNEFLFILDLERVLLEIEAMGGYQQGLGFGLSASTEAQMTIGDGTKFGNGRTIILVDDSSFILSNATAVLQRHGFRVIPVQDGLKAKTILESRIQTNDLDIAAIVTDVEMPRLDGLSLTKWIKSTKEISKIPVILHTSLSGKTNQLSGEQVGANGYIVKNDLNALLKFLEQMLK